MPTPTPPTAPVGTAGRRRLPSLGWLLAGLAVVAVLLAVVLVAPRLLYPPLTDRELDRQRVTDGRDRIELKREQDKLQNDARGALLQGLGGAVLLLGAYFTWRQVQTNREQVQQNAAATRDQLKLTREGQLTERFTRAVDQLGSDHLDVRLGGIYALERIARDSPPDRVTIGEVLSAYVRGHAPWPPTKKGQPPAHTPIDDVPELEERAADVQAAVTVLGHRELLPSGLRRLALTGVDLRKAWLGDEAKLQGARLTDANLQGARLDGADLQAAYLRNADLRGAWLDGADLRGAWLPGANLQGASLKSVRLDGAKAGRFRGGPETRWPEGFDPRAASVELSEYD
jgi:Pentapeptide repeats (8 copies)